MSANIVSKSESSVRSALRSIETSENSPIRLLAGVSGGADSVAMLVALHRLDIETECVHCNFHLRGNESDRDQNFVQQLCLSLDIPITVIHFDTAKYASDHKISIETACRELRYQKFDQLLREKKCTAVAIAHNNDDNIETMLLNMLRGTGLRGLAGMKTLRNNIFRPLLQLTRQDIEAYLNALGQDYITDSSNLSDSYNRNFIRLNILPLLESRWPGARKALSRTQTNLQLEETRLNTIQPQDESTVLTKERLANCPEPITEIFRFITPYGGNSSQAREIATSFQTNRLSAEWTLSGGNQAILAREGLIILSPNDDTQTIPDINRLPLTIDNHLIAEIRFTRKPIRFWTSSDTSKWRWRKPMPRDRIKSLGMKGSQLISDIIKDAHLGHYDKQKIWILCDGENLPVWIPGLKRSRNHLVDFNGTQCIEILPPADTTAS